MSDLYEKYKKSRNASWQVLIDCNVSQIPVKIIEVSNNLNVEVLITNDVVECKSFVSSDKCIIYIPSNIDDKNQLRYNITVRLANIILGLNYISDCNHINAQSHVFARDILAPACVLWKLNCIEPQDISELCRIPIDIAEKRSERMKILIQRNKFLTHPLERKVLKQFQGFIEQMQSK